MINDQEGIEVAALGMEADTVRWLADKACAV